MRFCHPLIFRILLHPTLICLIASVISVMWAFFPIDPFPLTASNNEDIAALSPPTTGLPLIVVDDDADSDVEFIPNSPDVIPNAPPVMDREYFPLTPSFYPSTTSYSPPRHRFMTREITKWISLQKKLTQFIAHWLYWWLRSGFATTKISFCGIRILRNQFPIISEKLKENMPFSWDYQ